MFETISQSLLSAVDRDALSGWGAVVRTYTVSDIVIRVETGSRVSTKMIH